MTNTDTTNPAIKKDILDIGPGDTVKVYQILKDFGASSKKGEEKKEKIQVFEGLVLARKHRKEAGATITVRKVVDGVGVEKIFPLFSPLVKKIEIVKRGRTKRAKLYYLKTARGKRGRLKTQEFTEERPLEEVPIEKSEGVVEGEALPEEKSEQASREKETENALVQEKNSPEGQPNGTLEQEKKEQE